MGNQRIMGLKIKEISKQKGIPMSKIAEELGITPITLSQSLNGNPTLSRLTEVAKILGVDVVELFDAPQTASIYGCLYVNGSPHIVNSKQEIEDLIKNL